MNELGLEIDVLGLLHYLGKRLKIALGITLLCGVAVFLAGQLLLHSEYEASTRVYALNCSDDDCLTSSDLSASTYLVSDIMVLITGENVAEAVINELELDLSCRELLGKIRVEAVDNSRVLEITATDPDASLAADIANCVREVAVDEICSIVPVTSMKLVYEAKIPTEPMSHDSVRNAVLVAAGCFLLTVCILSVQFFQNTSAFRNEH